MDILQVKKMCSGATYTKDLEVLEKLFERTGDRNMNGYLGSGIQNILFDDFSHLEFESNKQVGDLETISKGCVLPESVLISQVQKNKDNTYYQLFSWNDEMNAYTWLEFDSYDAMSYSYQRIKAFEEELCSGDLTEKLKKMNIPLDNIASVKVNEQINNDLKSMVDESVEMRENEDSEITLSGRIL